MCLLHIERWARFSAEDDGSVFSLTVGLDGRRVPSDDEQLAGLQWIATVAEAREALDSAAALASCPGCTEHLEIAQRPDQADTVRRAFPVVDRDVLLGDAVRGRTDLASSVPRRAPAQHTDIERD